MTPFTKLCTLVFAGLMGSSAIAQDLNVYSSRHYDSDDALYAEFTEQTGINVNRIEAKADELIARMEAEGALSPADVFIAVDAGRMARADNAKLLQAYDGDNINAFVPENLRHPDNHWFGVSQRARIIYYDKDKVTEPPQTYEALADEKWKGKICIRSSSNIYNQSLLASVIHTHGEETATNWAQGILDNMARAPQGGDTDQLRGIVSGECEIAVGNHYYFLRGFAKDVEGLTSGIDAIGWVMPNQDGRGTHMNLTGVGIAANAPNKENAQLFMEFLVTDFAQNHFAGQNNEYPAVLGINNPSTDRLGNFQADTTTPTSVYGALGPNAQQIFNQIGWD